MFEHFLEKLADGTLKAEPLSACCEFVRRRTTRHEETGSIPPVQSSTRFTIDDYYEERRHLSSEPADEKGLRLKYVVITNLWLLAQMRQPGRTIYRDLDRCTFNDFLDTLLDTDNFNFFKEVELKGAQ